MFIRNFLKHNIRHIIKLFINENYKIAIGNGIRYFHNIAMYITFLILLFINKKYIKYIFILTISIFILFILNDFGCILTFIERELLNDNYCDTDFYLNLINLNINKDHRIIISLFGFYLQLYILVLVYYLKNNIKILYYK